MFGSSARFHTDGLELVMKDALNWWCDHLSVFAGGLCIGAGSAWLGMSLTLVGAYLIMWSYGFVE